MERMAMIENGEAFRLSETCQGVIWKDDDGWHGCLRWDVELSYDESSKGLVH